MPAKEDFDSIFEGTKGASKKSAKKSAKKTTKTSAKKAPAKTAKKAAKTVAAKPAKKSASKAAAAPKAPAASKAAKAPVNTALPPAELNRFKALTTVLKNHESEALYRKGKEDRILLMSIAMLASLVFGMILVCAVSGEGRWFSRLFFAGAAALVGLAGGSILELNRKRLQDVLAMIVKIHESLGFFSDGTFPTGNGPYFPNTYKFIGSINDDETNYAQLIIKIAAAGAVIAILLLG